MSALTPDRSHYRAHFDQGAVPQSFVDTRGCVTEVNRAFCELLRCDPADAVGRHVRDFQHLHDRGEDAEIHEVDRLLSGEVESLQGERMLRRSDGHVFPALVSGTALRGPEGAVIGVAVFVQDLSRLRDLERRNQQQADFFLAISQHASDLAVVADTEGRLVYTSPALTRTLGFEPIEVLGESGNAFVHPDDVARNSATFWRVLTTGGSASVTLRLRNADGEWRWYEETMRNLVDSPVGGVVCNMRDITERVEAEYALRESEALYRAIVDNADEGLWVVTPHGRTLYVNSRLSEILGVGIDELYRRSAPDLFGENGPLLRHKIAHRHEVGPERYEICYDHPDGGRRTLRFAAAPLPEASSDVGALALVTDVTESRRLEAELRQAALHDSLTGLPNRALLLDRLEHSLQRDRSTAVLFVDLDQFKIVNDARGHAVGDELLVAAAARLCSAVRAADTVARFGGDEFVVVGEDLDELGALRLAEDLIAALEPPVALESGPVHVSASIGVALSTHEGDGEWTHTAQELLRRADTAMYAAKSAGRRAVRLFDQGLASDVTERYRLAGDLPDAMDRDQLRMHFQPVVDLHSGEVRAVEALCRWTHPDLGPISPERFVSIAEQSGLARELDHWVLAETLRCAGRMRAEGTLAPNTRVAVNLSAHSLADPEIERVVARCTEREGFSPGDVVLEITESAIMADTEAAAVLLTRLREAGFGVAVDDFGTGHSSLAYLDRFPVSTLKVDRTFVADLAESGTSRAIVASVVDLARALEVSVVAEGVEHAEQARHLRNLGCDIAQGWLWSPALDPDEAASSDAFRRVYVDGIDSAADAAQRPAT